MPKQKVLAKLKKRKKRLEGTVIEVLEKADYEINPLCKDFLNCGGCTFQNIDYEKELELKKHMLEKLLNQKIKIVEAPNINAYRNKMEFSFGDEEKNGKLALGMRKINSYYEVVTSRNCNIIDDDFKIILLETLEFFLDSEDIFYHKKTKEGALRHLVLRRGEFTGEIFVNIITKYNLKSDLSDYVKRLKNLSLKGKITGIGNTINNSVADVVICEEFNLLYGRDYFMEKLLNLDFKIYPFSFFQTNSAGAEKLYSTVKEFLGDSKDKIIFDLYCGTGTIGQIVSYNANQVIGIEIVEEAVKSANENAELNRIDNCKFIAGDVLKEVDNLNLKPDIIILDPPREGINPKAITKIINFNAENIIYISCKPTSLKRDLEILTESGYKIEEVRAHDMFPRTYHVETVVLLSKLNSAKSIEVEIELDKMDLTTAESKATYAEIKQYVLDNAGFNVSQLYIAQVKRKHGLIERSNYNIGNGKSKAPQVPLEKEKAIEDALRHFKMIFI